MNKEKKITVLDGGIEGKRYRLSVSEGELQLIASLLNSVDEKECVPLRQAVNQELRANDAFTLKREKKIVLCSYCRGASNVVLPDQYDELEIKNCIVCRGEGRVMVITSKIVRPVTPELLRMNATIPPKFSEINY